MKQKYWENQQLWIGKLNSVHEQGKKESQMKWFFWILSLLCFMIFIYITQRMFILFLRFSSSCLEIFMCCIVLSLFYAICTKFVPVLNVFIVLKTFDSLYLSALCQPSLCSLSIWCFFTFFHLYTCFQIGIFC